MNLPDIVDIIRPEFNKAINLVTPSDFEVRLTQLNRQEWQTLIRKVQGYSNKKIAIEDSVCIRTVEARAASIRKVLGVPTILEAVALVAVYMATCVVPVGVRLEAVSNHELSA